MFQITDMNNREPIDALIEALSPTQEDTSNVDDNLVQVNNSNNQGHIETTPTSPTLRNVRCLSPTPQHIPTQVTTPKTPPRQARLLIDRLRSSSLRRRLFKAVHCKYCDKYEHNREEIEKHLKKSQNCLLLYMREFRVNRLNGVLVKMYRCMACGSNGGFQLKRHLECNVNCFNYYKEKFDVLDWNQLKGVILNLTKPSRKSRSLFKRRIETAEYLRRKRVAKTVTQSLNSFLQDISLSSYKLCVQCNQYHMKESAKQIDITDPLYQELDLGNKGCLQ